MLDWLNAIFEDEDAFWFSEYFIHPNREETREEAFKAFRPTAPSAG